MIGDLNLARLAAICKSNETAVAGIAELQSRIALMGPTAGFKAANDIAKKNGIAVSEPMTYIAKILSESVDGRYRDMLEAVVRDGGGLRVGVDNAAIVKAGSADPRLDPDFYAAIRARDFRTLCCRYGGGAHHLPEIPEGAPDPDEVSLSGANACFGSVGIGWDGGYAYAAFIPSLAGTARDFGMGEHISAKNLSRNSNLFGLRQWCIYDSSEWCDLPEELGMPAFPWLRPLKSEYGLFGGSATIRVEGAAILPGIDDPRSISAQSAAKAFGSVHGRKVTQFDPPIVLPVFTHARLVPYAFGAAGRYGMADANHVRPLLGLLGRHGGVCGYLSLLDEYNGEYFRNAAANWYSEHHHNAADGCSPPGNGTERGGGTPYGI